MAKTLRAELAPLLTTASDRYQDLVLLSEDPNVSEAASLHADEMLTESVFPITTYIDPMIDHMREYLQEHMEILFSREYFARYESTRGAIHMPAHAIILEFSGAVSVLDCGSPKTSDLILSCQAMAEMVNVILRKEKVPLIVYVTLIDSDEE